MLTPEKNSNGMNRRSTSAPRSGGSYRSNNGWESQDMPSYMTMSSVSPPPSDNANNLQEKIKMMKLRRPMIMKKPSSDSAAYKLYAKFVHGGVSNYAALMAAITLWYLLGVVSIGTTKVLLNRGVPPLFLTIQQLFLGSNLLRLLLHFRLLGSAGLSPWPKPSALSPVRRTQKQDPESFWSWHLRDLVLSGVYFALGFAGTNLSFSGASPSFVETVKAAEPITSAATAVAWGIEVLSSAEVISLLTIVAGVLLSTLGNSQGGAGSGGGPALSESLHSSMTVMAANLCFSFRGLHQKLFRASANGGKGAFDDLNLQFRMQQIGIVLLIIPVLIWDSRTLVSLLWQPLDMSASLDFLILALVNGCAFTSYNLASTFVLTRISVVHHAALNCIRRIFAIIVTSIAFQVPITPIGGLGILVSVGGFMGFTHYKLKRQKQPKPISTLLPMSAA